MHARRWNALAFAFIFAIAVTAYAAGKPPPAKKPTSTAKKPTSTGSAAATGVKAAVVDRVVSFSKALSKGDLAAVCGKGMLCRALDGAGCTASKNFFSACYVMCGKTEGFRESQCAKGAVQAHSFDLERGVYTKGNTVENEPAAAHLVRQIAKAGSEDGDVKAGLCSVCGAVLKAPAAARREMLGANAASFEAACQQSCA